MVKDQPQSKTEGQLTGYAQNMHEEVAVDRSVDRPKEAATVDGISRPLDWPTEIPEFNQRVESLRICPAVDHPVDLSKEPVDRPSTKKRVLGS